MEDSPYSALKDSLSSVSAKALNYSSRIILTNNLDYKQTLQSEQGFARDYRGLAELIGFQYYAIKKFEESEDRTMKILESWETRPDATLDKLISYLEDMDRHDVIEALIPSLKKNVETYTQHQKSLESPIQVAEVTPGPINLHSNKRGVLTRDDLRNGECTIYDAYVSYADEDSNIAQHFSEVLESPRVGLKLFIRGRDMLAGCPELDTDIELIKNRCRRMLILLTPNFIKSPAAEFQVSFAGSLAIEQKQRILVPVILEPCELPPILNTVSKINFVNNYAQDWTWNKLIISLLPEDKSSMFLASLPRSPRSSRDVTPYVSSVCIENIPGITFTPPEKPNMSCVNDFNTVTQNWMPITVPVENTPVITFPPSAKHSISHQGPCSELKESVVCSELKESVASSEMKNSVACSEIKESVPSPKTSSKKFPHFMSRFKRKGNSSSASSASFSSGATSGFHSQSCSDLKSLENSNDSTIDTSM